jgi:hypothetical protein
LCNILILLETVLSYICLIRLHFRTCSASY